jgi:hypothetical protein
LLPLTSKEAGCCYRPPPDPLTMSSLMIALVLSCDVKERISSDRKQNLTFDFEKPKSQIPNRPYVSLPFPHKPKQPYRHIPTNAFTQSGLNSFLPHFTLQRTMVRPTWSPPSMFHITSAYSRHVVVCLTPTDICSSLCYALSLTYARVQSTWYRQWCCFKFYICTRPVHLMPATVQDPIPFLLHGMVRNKLVNLVHMNEYQLARNCKVWWALATHIRVLQ